MITVFTKLRVALGWAVLVGAAVVLAVQHRAISRLQAENSSLREENGQLVGLKIESQRLSNLVPQANRSLSGEQLSELLKLRSEVGFLRKRTNELGRSQAENPQLRTEVAAKALAAPDEQVSAPPRQIAMVSTNGQIEVVETTRLPVSEWSKVKIGRAGDIYLNKQQMSPAEFATECARLKKVGGAIVLFLDAPDHVASSAQAEVVRNIVEAGVAMKTALKEGDLE